MGNNFDIFFTEEAYSHGSFQARVTNVSTSLDLYIKFSTEPWSNRNFIYEAINSEHGISHGMANLLQESFRESPKASVTNIQPSHWRTTKEKKTQVCQQFVETTGLLKWLSVCGLTIWYFRPFGNAGLQFRRVLPSPPQFTIL